MSEKHNRKDMANATDVLPEDSFAGLKKMVDEGYAKFLKKRGLENDPKFNYGNTKKKGKK